MPQSKRESNVKSEPSGSVKEKVSKGRTQTVKQENIYGSWCTSVEESKATDSRIKVELEVPDEGVQAVDAVDKQNKLKGKKKGPLKRSKKQKSGGKQVKKSNSKKLSSELNEESSQEESRTSELLPCNDENDPEIIQKRTFYNCKLCKKDFSSAFILCLHLQIHEKVGSVQSKEDNDTLRGNTPLQVDDLPSNVTQKKADSLKPEVVRQQSSNIGEACTTVSTEPSACLEKKDTVGILNKNFVENLKKNLSLAMNRKCN